MIPFKKAARAALRAFALSLTAIFFTAAANASIVNVDPGDYSGQYEILGETGLLSGPQSLDLDPGDYLLQVARDSAGRVQITVDASGQVSSANTPAVSASGNTLSFHTADVTVDPTSDFTAQGGIWRPQFILTPYQSGPATFKALRNLGFLVQVGSTNGGRVRLHLDSNGQLTSDNPAAISASGSTATFNLVDITVDPTADYTAQGGIWTPHGATTGNRSGALTFKVAPNLRYVVQVGGHNGGRVVLTVDAAGQVSSANPAAMTAAGSTVTFNMVDVTVDPTLDFDGDWWGYGLLLGPQFGDRTFKVAPNLRYLIQVGGHNGGRFEFAVDAAGAVTSNNPLAATSAGSLLTFETTTIRVDTESLEHWQIASHVRELAPGPDTVTVVPNLRYLMVRFGSSVRKEFAVASPCAIDPPVIDLEGEVFEISCGATDLDADGAPDEVDNCPITPNADQLDRDLDGLGDVCDADLDGDGVANTLDNCADTANPDQDDLDGDGLGDLCDADTDGDVVSDEFDNCPADPNPEQADSDFDGAGDICDPDDDNDDVEDAADNCPLDPNAAQVDYDGDGEGDICDGDEDGDGVSNEADLCPLSPLDLIINLDGCTGGQAIALACRRDAFVQHGQYVSCVAHAANEAAAEGLISPKAKVGFIKEAAKK